MKLEEYLARPPHALVEKPGAGVPTPWLDFCELLLRGRRLHMVDASYTGMESEGCLVTLVPGTYRLQVKVRLFGTDARIAKLRVLRSGCKGRLGAVIGKTATDTATVSVYDYDSVMRVWQDRIHASWDILRVAMRQSRTHGVAVLDQALRTTIPFIHSGFGDGTFDVQELRAGTSLAGVEVCFIAPRTKYPFAK